MSKKKIANNDENEIKNPKTSKYCDVVSFHITFFFKLLTSPFRYVKLWPNDQDLILQYTMGKTYNSYIEKKKKIDEILQSRRNNKNNNNNNEIYVSNSNNDNENEGTTVQL